MNTTTQASDDKKFTHFGGNEIPQLQRVRAALIANTDLEIWNTEYTALTEFFGNTLRFIDFSLPCDGWSGYFSLEASDSEIPFTHASNSSCIVEELNIQSSYDLEIKKTNVSKLGEHLDILNSEIPFIYSSKFFQNTNDGVITLQTSFVKPLSCVDENELFYFLSIHKMLSHKYFPGITEIINS